MVPVLTDLVAIPDFLAGGMENWGLITFRETSLLVGKQASPLEKQVVASVIAHELAHQVIVFAFVFMNRILNMIQVQIYLWCHVAVVWKPGNNELVEWPVAQWRLRHLHGVHVTADSVAWAEHCECTHQTFKLHIFSKQWVIVYFIVYSLVKSWFCLQDNLFLDMRFRALDKDALNSSHAVSTEVNTPEQVEEMFDSVSYEKVQYSSGNW